MTKRAQWKRRIGQWERSGQSQRVFCARRGLALSSFQWWRSKLRRAEAQQPPTAAFLPLELGAVPGGAAAIEVELRSKTRLRLEGEAALRALDAVVARIR